MKIGVAIATYNGESYIRQQIESILSQSRLPDLISISDDGSSDKTLEIIRSTIDHSRHRVEVKIQQHQERLGVHENFFRAINACETDIVILSDQDDWWYPRKVEIIAHRMREHGVLACAHAYENVFEKEDLRRNVSLPDDTLDGSDVYPLFNWPGMALAFSRQVVREAGGTRDMWRQKRQEIQRNRQLDDFDWWADWHDNLLLTSARLGGRIAFISKCLGAHRLHSSNLSMPRDGWEPRADIDTSRDALVERYESRASFLGDFICFVETNLDGDKLAIQQTYEEWAKILRTRARLNVATKFSERAGCWISIAVAGGYKAAPHRGLGYKSALKDLAVVFGLDRRLQTVARILR